VPGRVNTCRPCSCLVQTLMNYYPQKQADPVELKNIFGSLLVMIKIFFDLNAQVTSSVSRLVSVDEATSDRLGTGRTLRGQHHVVHDAFPHAALLRSRPTAFDSECGRVARSSPVSSRLVSLQSNEPGVLDQVKTEICRAVALYADNYSDDFKPFAPQFALTIWSLLTRLDLSASFDEVTVDVSGPHCPTHRVRLV
jgi:hypothetical protein